MRRIIHLSDLHFGRTRPELLEPLLAVIRDLEPDLVALSGDLTQRARRSQFGAARAFLDRLDLHWLAVPGNHDVPLYNVPLRLTDPFSGYRRRISRDLEPVYVDEEIAVVGLNTVDPLAWQRGRVTPDDIARAAERAGRAPVKILMAHHPFKHVPDEPKALMKGAPEGLEALARTGFDVVLAGHLHAWRVEPVTARLEDARTLQVQAGTGLSTRLRGEENDFNLLTIDGETLTVLRYATAEGAEGFEPVASRCFERAGERWKICDGA
ncbi:MAG: metallophosphoesterase [Rhodobacteraceae bacterium]|nr:metallophosphoesterase [Paracoccaceae bacterium]